MGKKRRKADVYHCARCKRYKDTKKAKEGNCPHCGAQLQKRVEWVE